MIKSIIFIPMNGAITPPKPYTNILCVSILSECCGLYFTPYIARGIKSGMIIALKINADNIALEGVARFMIFKT